MIIESEPPLPFVALDEEATEGTEVTEDGRGEAPL
jgi:hypothetical protein